MTLYRCFECGGLLGAHHPNCPERPEEPAADEAAVIEPSEPASEEADDE